MTKKYAREKLRTAYAFHQHGKLSEAAKLCQELIATDPRDLYPTLEATVGNFEKAKGSMARLTAIGCPSIDVIENHAGAGARPS
jgi:hypothetical protein